MTRASFRLDEQSSVCCARYADRATPAFCRASRWAHKQASKFCTSLGPIWPPSPSLRKGSTGNLVAVEDYLANGRILHNFRARGRNEYNDYAGTSRTRFILARPGVNMQKVPSSRDRRAQWSVVATIRISVVLRETSRRNAPALVHRLGMPSEAQNRRRNFFTSYHRHFRERAR